MWKFLLLLPFTIAENTNIVEDRLLKIASEKPLNDTQCKLHIRSTSILATALVDSVVVSNFIDEIPEINEETKLRIKIIQQTQPFEKRLLYVSAYVHYALCHWMCDSLYSGEVSELCRIGNQKIKDDYINFDKDFVDDTFEDFESLVNHLVLENFDLYGILRVFGDQEVANFNQNTTEKVSKFEAILVEYLDSPSFRLVTYMKPLKLGKLIKDTINALETLIEVYGSTGEISINLVLKQALKELVRLTTSAGAFQQLETIFENPEAKKNFTKDDILQYESIKAEWEFPDYLSTDEEFKIYLKEKKEYVEKKTEQEKIIADAKKAKFEKKNSKDGTWIQKKLDNMRNSVEQEMNLEPFPDSTESSWSTTDTLGMKDEL